MRKIVFFENPAEMRAWFERHHSTEIELHAGFYKRGSGRPSVTWPESVDEALCVGWIDGVRRSADAESYVIRFTPRRLGSIWSTVNVRRVEALTAEGRMRPSGLAAFEKRKADKSSVYAYEQGKDVELPPWCIERFQAAPEAWAWFQGQAPWYRRQEAWRIVSAKQEPTRIKRLEKLIENATLGKRDR